MEKTIKSLVSVAMVLAIGLTTSCVKEAGVSDNPVEPKKADPIVWNSPETAPEAGATIIDNDFVTVKTVYETTAKAQEVTIGDYSFTNYFQLRVDKDPSAENVTGTEKSGSTPLVVTAKKNTAVTFFFYRQKGSNGFDFDDNKDILCYDQNESGFTAEEKIFDQSEDGSYATASKTYQFVKDGVYTIYRRGSTVRIYGIVMAEAAN